MTAPAERQAGLREALVREIDKRVGPLDWPNGLADRVLAAIDAALAAQVPAQELDVELLARAIEATPLHEHSKPNPPRLTKAEWAAAIAAEYRALGDESKEEGAAEHEHYWVDAADDETGWHCTACGVTEYPEPPFGAEAGPEEPDRP